MNVDTNKELWKRRIDDKAERSRRRSHTSNKCKRNNYLIEEVGKTVVVVVVIVVWLRKLRRNV